MRLRATKLSAYGGSARRLWTPAQLTTSVWLDAADASTITLNGATVSQWNDKSGNARNAVQATTAYQPLYAAYQNLLVYSQDFTNAAWSKSATSIVQNLVLRSQEFENASWNNSGLTVTANATTAPDGTNTARSLTETATSFAHNMYQTRSLAANRYTYSVYVKSNGRQYATVRLICGSSDWSGIAVDILNATGTLTTAGTVLSNVSSSVTSVGDGWVRVVLTVTSSAIITDCVVGTSDSATPTYTTFGNIFYAGDITKGIYVWGAQWVRGALAEAYTPTTTAAVAIPFADPIGGTTAQKVLENVTVATSFYVSQGVSASLGKYTLSMYLKAGERTNCAIGVTDNATGEIVAIFNLSAGTLVTSSASGAWSGLTTAITSAGSGWYRVSITGVSGGGTSLSPYIRLVESGTTLTYNGNGQSGVYAWGGQLNSGAIQPYQRTIGIASPGGVNSKPAVVTDGVDDALFVNSWGVVSQPFTRAFVFNPVAVVANKDYINSANIDVPSANASSTGDFSLTTTLMSQYSGNVVNNVTIAANLNYIRVSEFSAPSSRVYMNGVVTGPANSGANTVNGVCIGGYSQTGSGASLGSSNVRFGEFLTIPGVLSTDDRQKLEGYLAWKWGGA
jgi:hypothetical protein